MDGGTGCCAGRIHPADLEDVWKDRRHTLTLRGHWLYLRAGPRLFVGGPDWFIAVAGRRSFYGLGRKPPLLGGGRAVVTFREAAFVGVFLGGFSDLGSRTKEVHGGRRICNCGDWRNCNLSDFRSRRVSPLFAFSTASCD